MFDFSAAFVVNCPNWSFIGVPCCCYWFTSFNTRHDDFSHVFFWRMFRIINFKGFISMFSKFLLYLSSLWSESGFIIWEARSKLIMTYFSEWLSHVLRLIFLIQWIPRLYITIGKDGKLFDFIVWDIDPISEILIPYLRSVAWMWICKFHFQVSCRI